MDMFTIVVISFVNIGCTIVGFYVMQARNMEEDREKKSYRRMTELEIRLLNKKIEEVSGHNYRV
jgi:hypothetical protein